MNADFKNPANVGMRYLAGKLNLLLKLACHTLVICEIGAKYFEGNVLTQELILRQINFPHSTTANERNNAMPVRNHLTCGKRSAANQGLAEKIRCRFVILEQAQNLVLKVRITWSLLL